MPHTGLASVRKLHPRHSAFLADAVKVPEIGTSPAVAPASQRTKLIGRSEQAVYPVHVAAGDAQRLVMLADCVLIRAFQEAINLAVRVVVELNLAHTKLVGRAFARSLGYLVDGFLGSFRSSWKSMKLGMWRSGCSLIVPGHST
jgi:hypothetical protein